MYDEIKIHDLSNIIKEYRMFLLELDRLQFTLGVDWNQNERKTFLSVQKRLMHWGILCKIYILFVFLNVSFDEWHKKPDASENNA